MGWMPAGMEEMMEGNRHLADSGGVDSGMEIEGEPKQLEGETEGGEIAPAEGKINCEKPNKESGAIAEQGDASCEGPKESGGEIVPVEGKISCEEPNQESGAIAEGDASREAPMGGGEIVPAEDLRRTEAYHIPDDLKSMVVQATQPNEIPVRDRNRLYAAMGRLFDKAAEGKTIPQI